MNAPRQLALAAVALLLTVVPAGLHAQQDAPQQGEPGQAARGPARVGRGVRGTIVSASGTNVTLRTEGGESWTVATTDNTRINIDRQPVKAADLKAGDEVMAVGVVDQDKHEIHAMMLMGASAATAAKLKADMGKTYIVGKVTAINDTKLTLERADHVAQTITLDETTSLKRGGRMPPELMAAGAGGVFLMGGGRPRDGARPQRDAGRPARDMGEPTNDPNTGGAPRGMEAEAITLADVKVGDNVAGVGSIKNGSFVPTELHVIVPRQGRGARAAGNAPQANTPPQP